MTAETPITAFDAEAFLEKAVGSYAWFVRRSEDDVFRMEFGKPHLAINEPIPIESTASEVVRRTLCRRIVTPNGEWSLFVESAAWVVRAGGQVFARSNVDGQNQDSCLLTLSGQKLVKVSVSGSSICLKLEFDLGGEVEILPEESETEIDQWIFFSKENGNLFLGKDNLMYIESVNSKHKILM